MLQIQHLTMTHRRDLRVLLSDFTFALQPGDRAALIGEEGNGKSTLLRLLYREELVRDYIEYHRRYPEERGEPRVSAPGTDRRTEIRAGFRFLCGVAGLL